MTICSLARHISFICRSASIRPRAELRTRSVRPLAAFLQHPFATMSSEAELVGGVTTVRGGTELCWDN
jgi:hypothetical protein